MLEDRYQKRKLLKYFLDRGWYPQLEVNVAYRVSMNDKPKIITDIDVFALSVSNQGSFQPILGDCKTLGKQSPINRVLWLKGLMSLFKSDYGIILLSKKIDDDHKLLASELGVSLLSDDDFQSFSNATANESSYGYSALENIDLWDKYFSISSNYKDLSIALQYCQTEFWNKDDYSVKLRNSFNCLRAIKKYVNPDNKVHIFLVLEIASLFSIAISDLTIKIFNTVLHKDNKGDFSEELKVLVWGGYEKYNYYKKVMYMLQSKLSSEEKHLTNHNDLSFHEWSSFVQLIRSCIDKPFSTTLTPLIIKELAFSYLDENSRIYEDNSYIKLLIKKDSYAVKNAIMIIDYLVKALSIPKEFSDINTNLLMQLQRK